LIHSSSSIFVLFSAEKIELLGVCYLASISRKLHSFGRSIDLVAANFVALRRWTV
jgi:hypothetical protein